MCIVKLLNYDHCYAAILMVYRDMHDKVCLKMKTENPDLKCSLLRKSGFYPVEQNLGSLSSSCAQFSLSNLRNHKVLDVYQNTC